ncbi:MAG: hypothetical protein EXS63_01375 [Candidatus Omnitrophica bacterium]|nr:hypothetical protein [Candidatus Omnitrophota bacterium]
MKLKHLIASLIVTGSMAFGIFSCLHFKRITTFFSYYAYYLILLLVTLWLIQLILHLRKNTVAIKVQLLQNRWGILLALVLTAIVFISVPTHFRILSDETNLLAVSKSMAYEHRVDNVTMGKWYYHNFYPLNREFEKRPLLFPFLLHVIHTLLGYRPENAFFLNGIILFTLLAILFLWVRRECGKRTAILTLVFAVSQPVLTQTATCAGFDLAFVLFFILALACLHHFLRKPSPDSFQWLWINLLMLANTRYESPLVVITILLALLVMGNLKRSYFSPCWIFALTPLATLPGIWQHWLRNSKENPFGIPADSPTFSFHHFLHHQKIFLKSFLNFYSLTPYATVLNWIGILGLLYFLVRHFQEKNLGSKTFRQFSLITFLSLAGLWILFHSYHFGDIGHPASARFFVIFYLAFSFLAAAFLVSISPLHSEWLYGLGAACFFLYHPLSVENRFSNQLLLPREYRITLDFLKKIGHQNLLVISERPGQYTVENYGAVDFKYANQNKDDLLRELGRHLYQEIYVIREINYETKKPVKDTTLHPAFQLEPVFEFQNKADAFVQISKVILTKPLLGVPEGRRGNLKGQTELASLPLVARNHRLEVTTKPKKDSVPAVRLKSESPAHPN